MYLQNLCIRLKTVILIHSWEPIDVADQLYIFCSAFVEGTWASLGFGCRQGTGKQSPVDTEGGLY